MRLQFPGRNLIKILLRFLLSHKEFESHECSILDISVGLNANEIQIPYYKHHKVSSSVKSHQSTQFCQTWSNMKMLDNPGNYEVLIEQYLHSVLDISAVRLVMYGRDYGILDNNQWLWKILGIKFSRLHKLLLIGSSNPLTPGAFCEKGLSWWFLGWISVKLPLIWSKMHLHHDSLSFLSLASRFATFFDILTRACAEIKIMS